ncbi:MAG: ferrous iron transport protein A [Candidatus Omnitrophota bacterium]|nr:MAG: ferrous iron transport protein A [Candidatus Omnitrophota bacterium]
MNRVSLVRMKRNQKGKIVEIAGGKALHDRLTAMGIYVGKEVALLNHSIFKGPVAIRVGRSILALGFGMASKIIVEVE